MNFYRRRLRLSAPSNLALLVLAGLVLLILKPAWLLENGTPITAEVELFEHGKSFSFLENTEHGLVLVSRKSENGLIRCYNFGEGLQWEAELNGLNPSGAERLLKADGRYWFCAKDKNYDTWLVSCLANNQAVYKTRRIHDNPWIDDIDLTYTSFCDGWEVECEIFEGAGAKYQAEKNGKRLRLKIGMSSLGKLWDDASNRREESEEYKKIDEILYNLSKRNFSYQEIFGVISDKLRRNWLRESLNTNRGQNFFDSDIMTVTDLSGDGREEFLILICGDRYVPGYLTSIDVISSETNWKVPFYNSLKSLKTADLDGDGRQEIILSFYASGIGFSRDWFDHPVRLHSSRSYVIILDDLGNLKEFNGQEGFLSTGGFTSEPKVHILPCGELLLGISSSQKDEERRLIKVNFAENRLDTLDITYNTAVMFRQKKSGILFFSREDGVMYRHELGNDLRQKGLRKLRTGLKLQFSDNETISFNKKEYMVTNPLHIVDNRLKVVYQNLEYEPAYVRQKGKEIFFQENVPDSDIKNIYRLRIEENTRLNPYYVMVWLFVIILFIFYIVMQSLLRLPVETLNGSYAVLYRFLGIFYNWRLIGNSKMYHQPVVASLSARKFYDIIQDICENYRKISSRDLGLVQLKIYQLSIGNEMYIIQRIAHDIKNQVQLLNMQMEEKYELESENERKRQEEIDDRIGAALREIYNKTSTLSNFSRINLMNREVCDLVSIIDDLLIRYSSHKRYKDIDWEPEKSSIKVLGDENLLLTGLMNILENALRYSEENSKVKIKTEIEGDTVVLKFINQKAPDNHEPQLKLESARNVTLNSGIGLMLSERIIRSHGGELEVNMQDNEVEIVIRLRLMEKP